MEKVLQQQINKFAKKPYSLFAIDGLGALLSAVMLGVVLVHFQPYVGVPTSSLYLLAAIPLIFVVYDLSCYLQKPVAVATYLRLVAYANLAYCAFSLGIAIFHHEKLTFLGWAYVVGEILIITGIAIFELQVAAKTS